MNTGLKIDVGDASEPKDTMKVSGQPDRKKTYLSESGVCV